VKYSLFTITLTKEGPGENVGYKLFQFAFGFLDTSIRYIEYGENFITTFIDALTNEARNNLHT